MASQPAIRVLVVDDSAYNRQTISSMLANKPGISVVGRAADGNDGLKQVFDREPDVITLDLEMPRMDGFTFLRILMRRRPTPVLVISSYSKQENVFKALELGAIDFIAKPTKHLSPELRDIENELVDKIALVGNLRQVSLVDRASHPEPAAPGPEFAELGGAFGELRVLCVGASTGGPPAIKQLLAGLPASLPLAVVISQHMPPTFTAAFASRLDRACTLEVREARSGDRLRPGLVLVCPGERSVALERHADGGVRVRVETADETAAACGGRRPRYVPSINRMMESAAEVLQSSALGMVLTGMGDDGAAGVAAIKRRGGYTLAESAESAVIFGMPDEAIRTGAIDEVVALEDMAGAIVRYCQRVSLNR
jgi:two-component system, chemotaxis family, protein-glutamate methylesterase/glutaminase